MVKRRLSRESYAQPLSHISSSSPLLGPGASDTLYIAFVLARLFPMKLWMKPQVPMRLFKAYQMRKPLLSAGLLPRLSKKLRGWIQTP